LVSQSKQLFRKVNAEVEFLNNCVQFRQTIFLSVKYDLKELY